MLNLVMGAALAVFGVPKTVAYDAVIEGSGVRMRPGQALSVCRLATAVSLLGSALSVWLFCTAFSYFHPVLLVPSLYFLACVALESVEVFDASVGFRVLAALASYRRTRAESELPYALLFLNQALGLGVPLEAVMLELYQQEGFQQLRFLVSRPHLVSRPIQEFQGVLAQCERVGATPQVLDDLVAMSSMHTDRALSWFKALGVMAGSVFTYVLALYACSILVIVVASVNGGVAGLEFLLLVVVNPVLFLAGFVYVWLGRSA